MRVSVLGLGYVGSVTAACLANNGHEVAGVDSQTAKVDLINQGKSPVIEQGLEELISKVVDAGCLRATSDVHEVVLTTDLTLVCVGTPSHANGSTDLTSIRHVCEEIGSAIREKDGRHVVIIRSTVPPGTMRQIIQPLLEETSGKRAGEDFGLSNNPEFLRESTAIKDFYAPPKTVIGASDERTAKLVASLYEGIDSPLFSSSLEVAEMVKYADNSWHALKVAFGNEIGNVCKAIDIDSHQVMDIFCQDTTLNLSPYYLKPGFAFGGSCLPKDLRALVHLGRTLDLSLPVLENVMVSNQVQISRAFALIAAKQRRKIGFLGISFKAGTDDLRESPQVELVERLIGKGYDIRIYDRNVNLARLTGANREFIAKTIPHIAKIMVESIEEVIAHAEVVVVGNSDPAFSDVPSRTRPDQVLIDLVRLPLRSCVNGEYDGINW